MGNRLPRLLLPFLATMLLTSTSAAYEQEIARLSSTMAEKISRAGKTRIAVVDFTDLQGRVTELGRFLAEEFSVHLAGSDQGFRVVDRTHLRSILEEHKLATTGLIDPATARELGKIAGVEALVTATITPFGDSVRLSVKVLDTESADVIDAATGNIAKTEAIAELLGSTLTNESRRTAPSTSREDRGSEQQTLEMSGVKFELLGCRRSGEQVSCNFLITMLDEDNTLTVYAGDARVYGTPKSRVFDSSGNEFVTQSAYIGPNSTTRSWKHQLVAGIPVRAGWIIEGVPLDVSSLAAIDFGFATPSLRGGRLQMRNVPVRN